MGKTLERVEAEVVAALDAVRSSRAHGGPDQDAWALHRAFDRLSNAVAILGAVSDGAPEWPVVMGRVGEAKAHAIAAEAAARAATDPADAVVRVVMNGGKVPLAMAQECRDAFETMRDALFSVLNLEWVANEGRRRSPSMAGLDVPYHFEKVRKALAVARTVDGVTR